MRGIIPQTAGSVNLAKSPGEPHAVASALARLLHKMPVRYNGYGRQSSEKSVPSTPNTLQLFTMQIWGVCLSESHIFDATFRRPCGNPRRAIVALTRWGCKAIVTHATQAYVLDSV
jgi:hypothetical protein